jgi:tRNA (cmo5U34)-methyltransferase
MDMPKKSTPEEIRLRFDRDVERFSNLQTAQSSAVDAPLVLELIAITAAALHPQASQMLDIGCGAGNYSLRMRQLLPGLGFTLIDLSRPMLDRALERLSPSSAEAIQGDIRDVDLDSQRYDFAVAAAVLHHLRADEEWRHVFRKVHASLKPGGSFWIADLIDYGIPQVREVMWRRYGEYLAALKDEAYRDHVLAYVAKEDSPRPLAFQLDLLREVGFTAVDVLHSNSCFAAFGAVKAG